MKQDEIAMLSGFIIPGCYPKCPAAQPYFDEDTMKCVEECGCYVGLLHYNNGQKVPTTELCQTWYVCARLLCSNSVFSLFRNHDQPLCDQLNII